MKKFASYLIYTLLLATVVCACSDNLDIKSDYEFEVTHLPVPKKLEVRQTAEIECTLVRHGEYKDTKYFLRYFQENGNGSLKLNDKILIPNRLYELKDENFCLYFTSLSEEQQSIELTFIDSFGKEFILKFDFSNKNSKEEDVKVSLN